MIPKCPMKMRVDDIPKHRKGEKTWACDLCGALRMGRKKPPCSRTVMQRAVASVNAEKKRLNLKD
jgi:hypothetical protein